MPRLRQKIEVQLPEKLAAYIEGKARTAGQRYNMTAFFHYVFARAICSDHPFFDHIDISKKHFTSNLSGRAYHVKFTAEADGVLDVDHFYYPGADGKLGQCKRYAINPEYLEGDPVTIEYEAERPKFDPDVLPTVRVLQRLRIAQGMHTRTQQAAYVRQLVTPAYIRAQIKVGQEIPEGVYSFRVEDAPGVWRPRYDRAGNPRQFALPYLLSMAEQAGGQAILHGSIVYIGSLKNYLRRRVASYRAAYQYQLQAVTTLRKRGNIRARRNDTNHRLDTNITNLKSDFLQFMRLDGEGLVSLDLGNSQFLILAGVIQEAIEYAQKVFKGEGEHITNSSNFTGKFAAARCCRTSINPDNPTNTLPTNYIEDVISPICVTLLNNNTQHTQDKILIPNDLTQFLKLTKKGVFYEHLVKLLSAADGKNWTRKEAKLAMMRIAFSSHRYPGADKKLIAAHFPTLIAIMDAIKKAGGNKNALAVLLQTIESRIFIDDVLHELHSAGLSALSKHDSILIKQSEKKAAEAILRSRLDHYFGPGCYQIKVEGEPEPERGGAILRQMPKQPRIENLRGDSGVTSDKSPTKQDAIEPPPVLKDSKIPGLAKNGELGRGRPNSSRNTRPLGESDTASYLIARLKRDDPD